MTPEQVRMILDTMQKLAIESDLAVIQGQLDLAAFCQIRIGFWRTIVSPYLN